MAAIAPEKVLKQLGQLWAGLASPDHGTSTESGVLRACSMTFIVAMEPGDDPQSVGQTIAELMHAHPSRAIVLKPGPDGTGLDATVSAQCWMPFGKRQQVCCEQIEVMTPLSDAVSASHLILGLLAPDLPAVLWSRGASWLESPGFADLLPLMTKVVVDTTVAGCSIAELAHLRPRVRHVADLAWTRTTPVRQDIARFFEDQSNRSRLDSVNSIIVPPGAIYLGAWLQRVLPGRKLSLDAPPSLVRLEGPGTAFEFSIPDRNLSDCALLLEELTITGADPTFESLLPLVRTLA
jgi:hypothetical protein